jgi:hypothetical protein
MHKGSFGRAKARTWKTVAIAALVVLVFAMPVLANLSGSTFEGGDGNLLVDTAGNTDWQNAPNLVVGLDNASGGSDNAFGQGTKEDNASVTVVSGSIPPNKSDLTRFYVASEFANDANYLYLAWERSNVLGSANMDFEINQATTPGLGNPGPHVINRTAGDLLVTYDFTNGGSKPVLGLLTWVTTGSTNQCFSANSLPCWGNHVDLNSTDSEGAINTVSVTDPINPGAPRTLAANTFGEAAINLTAAGIFGSTCKAFGSVFLKSRSSASFTAEVKDFVAPQPVNISNCGEIIIHKVTENGDASFGYTTTGGLNPPTFNLSNGGEQDYTDLSPGDYSVTESSVPAGWNLKSLVCTASGTGTSYSVNGATVSITLDVTGLVDCTYTNHTNLSPTITTTLSEESVPIGTTVHDSAELHGATANAGGTVTYTVYTDTNCSQNPIDAGTVTVTNGIVPDSNGVTFNQAGTFYWQAVYSGDPNNNGASSLCTSEILVVNPNPTSLTTAQRVIPNDRATLSGATSNAGGTISFKLFAPSAPTCSGSPAFSQTVNVNGNGTYATTNSAFAATAQGTWRWLVVYSGDGNNQGSTSACGVENFTITNG